MYAIIVHYIQPLEEIDKHLQAHRAWLKEQYGKAHFLISGPQDPRAQGGFILSDDMPREELDRILAQDPFSLNGVATHEVLTVRPSMADPKLSFILQPA